MQGSNRNRIFCVEEGWRGR